MGKLVIGLVTGLVLGVGGGWLIASITVVDAMEQKLEEEKSVSETGRNELGELQSKYDGLVESSAAELAQVKDRLSEKDEQVAALETEKNQLAPEIDKLRAEKEELVKTVAAFKEKYSELTAEPAETEPENPEALYRKQMEEIGKRITVIGGPLNELAIEELELDENQVAGINELLKEEGKRMKKRLIEWAAKLSKDKTLEDVEKMTDLELAYSLGQHVTKELELLQKLSPEEKRTIHVKNHFIKFLPKDGNLVGIVKTLYEERQKTYGGLAAYVSEEQEKAIKEKYVTSGTFIIPGAGSFGIGHLKPEDFEE
jgi:hypothetical protein